MLRCCFRMTVDLARVSRVRPYVPATAELYCAVQTVTYRKCVSPHSRAPLRPPLWLEVCVIQFFILPAAAHAPHLLFEDRTILLILFRPTLGSALELIRSLLAC